MASSDLEVLQPWMRIFYILVLLGTIPVAVYTVMYRIKSVRGILKQVDGNKVAPGDLVKDIGQTIDEVRLKITLNGSHEFNLVEHVSLGFE